MFIQHRKIRIICRKVKYDSRLIVIGGDTIDFHKNQETCGNIEIDSKGNAINYH